MSKRKTADEGHEKDFNESEKLHRPKKQKWKTLPRSSYEVGYAKPPIEHRFRPGQSGNPSGRPKGARNKPSTTSARLATMFRKELTRMIPVGQDGRQITMPMHQIVLRSLLNQAAKGNVRAGVWVASTQMQIERDEMQQKQSIAQEVFEYKCAWTDELAFRRAHGFRGLPDPVPHPDHIKFDREGNWWVSGPVSDAEIERDKEIEVLRQRWKKMIADLVRRYAFWRTG